jgi:hypothetical protein
VDESSLRQLGVERLTSVPATRNVEAWCWDYAEATGDSRYCGLARALEQIAEVWDDHSALPFEVLNEIHRSFRKALPGVMDAESAEEGAGLARLLREEIAAILLSWSGQPADAYHSTPSRSPHRR